MEQQFKHNEKRYQRPRGRGRGRGFPQNSGPRFGNTSVWNSHYRSRANADTMLHKNANSSKQLEIEDTPAQPAANLKFEEACAKIQQSVQRFVHTAEDENTSEEEEEEVEKDSILKNVLSPYGDVATDGNLQRTRQFLLDSLNAGACVCLICIESVKRSEYIWSCCECYCIFHLSCIQKWSKDSIYHQASSADNENVERSELTWCCPKCRKEYAQKEHPRDYLCFCGKRKDPEVDLWLIPHSCGQECRKKLQPVCGHECLLLCHPGPCPPCPKTVYLSCHCGRQKPIIRRCSDRKWSCSTVCDKLLNCDQHRCTQHCHEGDCETCPHQSMQNCQCGKKSSLRPCASPQWQCVEVCGKELSCGFHSCDKVCHKETCGDCPRAESRYCPCGKTSMKLPCTEDIYTCGDTCDKHLECGIHRCGQRCHNGSCGTCLQMRLKKCRCGAREKSVPCCKEYTCETKCKNLRDCKRHSCSRKCCDGNCPPCEQPCGRTLNCRNHKCSSRCHLGPCYPCPKIVEVTCNCKSTKIVVPCGRQKNTKPPKCKKLCKVPPNCNHDARDPHKCHFENCPPCQQICNKILEPCKHVCPVICHIAVLTVIIPSQKRAGPWEPIPMPRTEIQDRPCPPCLVPMPLTCLGGHETFNYPCSQLRPLSCGRKCGRLLSCTNHTCLLECHTIENAKSAYEAGETCAPCEEACTLSRPNDCTHSCPKPCHPSPCPPCNNHLRLRCHCQLNCLYVLCSKWTEANDYLRVEMMSCQNRCPKELTCGHRCPEPCHTGDCPTNEVCKKKVILRCPCKRIKRELPCNVITSSKVSLECDEVCKELQEKEKAAQLAEEENRRLEEQRRQQEELDEFLRKTERRKRKPRKVPQIEEELPWWKRHWKKIIVGVTGIVIGFYFAKIQVSN